MSGEDQRSSFCKIKGSSKSTPFLQCYSSVEKLQLKPVTPVENISDAKPLTSAFAKRSPGGGGHQQMICSGKKKKKRNCWLCSLEQNDASITLPSIRRMHSLITSHQERWWRRPSPVLLRAVPLTCHGLKTSQDFSHKWDKVPQSVCGLQMAPLYIKGQDPRSQMKHEAGWRQINHTHPGPASFQRRNGVRRYCRVKDRLGTCKKGWCLACPSSYSCRHKIGTEVSQKCMARITGCERAGNSERVSREGMSEARWSLNVSSPPLPQMRTPCLLLQETAEIIAVFCSFEPWGLSGAYSDRTYDQKGAFSIGKL